MTTITIEVTDEQARQLTQEAERLNVTPEDIVLLKTFPSADVDPEFISLTQRLIEEDRELLELLA